MLNIEGVGRLMSGAFKLWLFFTINLVSLIYLIIDFIRQGYTYQQALRIVWDMIITESMEYENQSICLKLKWGKILHKSWWLMLLLGGLFWIESGRFSTFFILSIMILHLYWYLHMKIGVKKSSDQVLLLHGSWGILYQEILPSSVLEQKSLAELDLRKKNLLVLAIERNSYWLPFPKGSEMFKPADRVLLFGEIDNYRAIIQS